MYDALLLVSEPLLNKSTITLNYDAKLLGEEVLRGRKEPLNIFSISKKSDF